MASGIIPPMTDKERWEYDESQKRWGSLVTTTIPHFDAMNSKKNAEENKMKFKKYADIRSQIADVIAGSLEEELPDFKVRILSEENDRNGPMGGRSSQILTVVDDGTDGGLVGVAINVYSDANIDSMAREFIGALEREAEDRARLFPAGDDA